MTKVDVPLRGRTRSPTKLLQVYVDDFYYAVTQSDDGEHIPTIQQAAIHVIHDVFPPTLVTHHTDGKEYGASQVEEAFKAAVEAGITFFDTAEVYGLGESERLLGKFTQETDISVSQTGARKRYLSEKSWSTKILTLTVPNIIEFFVPFFLLF